MTMPFAPILKDSATEASAATWMFRSPADVRRFRYVTSAHRQFHAAASWLLIGLMSSSLVPIAAAAEKTVRVSGEVRDAKSGAVIASRLYIQGEDGAWHFPLDDGSTDVVRYDRENYWDKSQVEKHATLAAKPFRVDLPPGEYAVTAERGKEYRPLGKKLTVTPDQAMWDLRLRRWVDMAARGWYSGDMHCHRSPDDLANLMLAEDVNVCFPLTYWTTIAERPPSRGDKTIHAVYPAAPIAVDATHVWYPRNTEYEIFKVGGREHTLGAFLILNHRTPFELPCPPLSAIAKRAHEEGALIDLEKHNWEWAAIAAPILPADLFELANNHNWRIGFGVKNWGAPAAKYMNVRGPLTIDNEPDWIEYGWRFYYALLNSGLNLQPTAGSASGAHPVPLGYSRVYVHLPDGFSYAGWLAGLKAGRSFVTTGPMLLVTVNGRDPGERFDAAATGLTLHVRGEALSSEPLERIELVWNGEVIRSIPPANESQDDAFRSRFDLLLPAETSGWLAARCIGRPSESGGIPFAHTAPWHVDVAGRPLQPKRHEVQYFLERVEAEIDRNRDVLTAEQLADYLKARDFWRAKLKESVEVPVHEESD